MAYSACPASKVSKLHTPLFPKVDGGERYTTCRATVPLFTPHTIITCNIQPQVVAGSTRRRRANGFLRPCRSRAAPPDYAKWVSLLLKHLGPLWCLGRVRRRALCLQADRWDEYAPATPSAPQGYHMRSLARMHALTRARERASAPLSSHHPVPVHGLVHWPHCRCVTPALSCAECAVVR